MSLFNAFEITADDVQIVLAKYGHSADEKTAEDIFEDFVSMESDRVASAALRGNDMDEQTNYAHEEIAAILREEKVLQ